MRCTCSRLVLLHGHGQSHDLQARIFHSVLLALVQSRGDPLWCRHDSARVSDQLGLWLGGVHLLPVLWAESTANFELIGLGQILIYFSWCVCSELVALVALLVDCCRVIVLISLCHRAHLCSKLKAQLRLIDWLLVLTTTSWIEVLFGNVEGALGAFRKVLILWSVDELIKLTSSWGVQSWSATWSHDSISNTFPIASKVCMHGLQPWVIVVHLLLVTSFTENVCVLGVSGLDFLLARSPVRRWLPLLAIALINDISVLVLCICESRGLASCSLEHTLPTVRCILETIRPNRALWLLGWSYLCTHGRWLRCITCCLVPLGITNPMIQEGS